MRHLEHTWPQKHHVHIIVKMSKVQDKEKMLKAAREKLQVTYKSKPIRITADVSTETVKARRA
jgi:hypothetical protein